MSLEEMGKLDSLPKEAGKLLDRLYLMGKFYDRAYIVSRKPKNKGEVHFLIEKDCLVLSS